MKTYDEEYENLVAWCEISLNYANKKIAQLLKLEGRDNRAANIRNPVWHEWNCRLIKLKIKYGIQLTQQEEKLRIKFKRKICHS
jgi:hypothetical protein